jgi:hypothetical protein
LVGGALLLLLVSSYCTLLSLRGGHTKNKKAARRRQTAQYELSADQGNRNDALNDGSGPGALERKEVECEDQDEGGQQVAEGVMDLQDLEDA